MQDVGCAPVGLAGQVVLGALAIVVGEMEAHADVVEHGGILLKILHVHQRARDRAQLRLALKRNSLR
jgi:hypothetical protein